MRKILISCLTLLLLCVAVNSHALSSAIQAVLGVTSSGGTSCSTSTDFIGNKTGTWDNTATGGDTVCQVVTATCAGTVNCTLNTGVLSHHGTSTDKGKISVYVYGNANPNHSSNTLLDYSGEISSNTDDELASAAMTNNAAVTNGTSYWMCTTSHLTDDFTYHLSTTETPSKWQRYCSGQYATPKADLSQCGGDFTETASRRFFMYVTVGP